MPKANNLLVNYCFFQFLNIFRDISITLNINLHCTSIHHQSLRLVAFPGQGMQIFLFIINPILIQFYPRKRGWPDLPHSASNLSHSHLAQFFASSFFKPTLLLSFSTCDLHFFLSRPHFLLPFTSYSNAFLKT